MLNNKINVMSGQFRLADGTRPCKSGSIYIGKANTDPSVAANQIAVTGSYSNGTTKILSQPISTNDSGYPIDTSGVVVDLLVNQSYSISVYDYYQKLQYNNPEISLSFSSAEGVKTTIDVTVDQWLSNTVITPDMFYNDTDADWSTAFKKAADKSSALRLPVTFLPRTYTFNDAIDFSIFPNGFVCENSRNNKVILKANGNSSSSEVFITMKNVDRRKTGGFLIDANNLFDVAFDTSWDKTGGPSLMMTWEKIQIQGWRKIGWRANNNNDVWNKNVVILEPGADVSADAVSYYNHSAGGPISFEGCSFQGGRVQVTAQHISANYCVFRGIEFKTGGSGWNTFAALGCHFFKDKYYNSCFVFAGNIQGFTVIGGLVEPTDGGFVFNGLGTGYFNCGQLHLLNTRISSYSATSPALLFTGSMLSVYENTTIKIEGGIAELDGYKPTTTGWVNTVIMEKVLFNKLSNRPVTRVFTTDVFRYSTSRVANVVMSSFDSTGCLVTDLISSLSTTGRNFGNIAALDGAKTTRSAGVIRLAYSDGTGYSEYRYVRTGINTVTLTLLSEFYSDSTKQINVYTSNTQYIYVANARAAGSTGENWTLIISYTGSLDYLP